jgi:hypothetical protein
MFHDHQHVEDSKGGTGYDEEVAGDWLYARRRSRRALDTEDLLVLMMLVSIFGCRAATSQFFALLGQPTGPRTLDWDDNRESEDDGGSRYWK